MIYSPDAWVIVKVTPLVSRDAVAHYRVFAGWYGGYCGSDSWKVNSGIVLINDHPDHYEFIGSSGSVYKCFKDAERMTGYMSQVLPGLSNERVSVELAEVKDINLSMG